MKNILKILKDSEYSLDLFSKKLIKELDAKIIEKNKKYYIDCIIREKEILLKPEEVVRQLYTKKLIEEYGYPKKKNKI